MTGGVLALDQSVRSCGWALLTGDGTPSTGAWQLSDGIAQRAAAFVQLHRNLERIHQESPLRLVVCEAPVKMRMDKVDKLVALYGLVAHIESWCRARNVRVEIVDQRTWRTTFLGKNYAKGKDRDQVKRDAVLRARQFGFDPATDDEAEAIGLLDHALHSIKVTPAWRVAQPFLGTL